MRTSKEYIQYLLEQLSHIGDVSARSMMGEYILYYNGKLIGDVCENRLLIKPVEAAKKLLPNAPLEPPYDGAKPMLVVEEIEDKEFMQQLFDAVYPELPFPKPKKPKK